MNKKFYRYGTTIIALMVALASCKFVRYSFTDASIPPEVKTVKVNYIDNKARYINPQLSPRLTDKLRDKIIRQTRLSQTNSDEAHYIISGYISDYSITTSGISATQAATNRLTVSVSLSFRNNLTQKNEDVVVSRSFDFPANISQQQAEAQLTDEMVRNLTDEIFNKIFSNW
jgi:outer membrane lipopolysaccharide assembly protein LptE/RlpB